MTEPCDLQDQVKNPRSAMLASARWLRLKFYDETHSILMREPIPLAPEGTAAPTGRNVNEARNFTSLHLRRVR